MTELEREFLESIAGGLMIALQGLANGESVDWFKDHAQQIDDRLCALKDDMDADGRGQKP